MIGQVVGNYEIIDKIGEGGMGAVYRAQHNLLGKYAAVKVLLPQLSSNAEVVARFFNEAKATSVVEHPGIVEIFDFGHLESGAAYIVMELLDGDALADRMHEPMSIGDAVSIIQGIAMVLRSAHAHNIVHRDLKPDNVILVPDPAVPGGERPKVLDFGIAKLASETSGQGAGSVRTRTGVLMGTPVYMAPEQCRGAGTVDHRADIYSLACILYEMLVGQPPFVGEGAGEIIAAHIHVEPPPLRVINSDIPVELEQVVMWALAKDPGARYQTMEEFAQALDPFAAVKAVPGRPATQVGTGSSPGVYATPPGTISTLSAAAAQYVDGTQPPVPSKRRTLGVVVAIAVAAVAGIGFAIVGGGSEPAADTTASSPQAVAQPAPEPKPTPPVPLPEPKPAPEPQEVTLTIESAPTGAEVYRAADGIKVGKTPYTFTVPKGDGEAVFLVKKRKYLDARVALPIDRDGVESVQLERKSRGGARHGGDKKPPKTDEPTRADPKDGALDPFN